MNTSSELDVRSTVSVNLNSVDVLSEVAVKSLRVLPSSDRVKISVCLSELKSPKAANFP